MSVENQSIPVYFLLVDDLEENLRALEGLLRREGLYCLKARSGSQALELLLVHDVALAIVDIQMPGIDGFELAELMRGTERTRRIPIIFVTAGFADNQRRFRGYEAGAVDFLSKPIDPDVLKIKADVFFDLYRQRQEVAIQRDELRQSTLENQRLLRESRKQAEALREADRHKDEFLAVLAHELRNPLAPIRNAIEILKQRKEADRSTGDVLEIADRQVKHMARLIDDLLDVARIARGKIELRKERCDLAAIAAHTAEDYRPTIESLGIALEVRSPEERVIVDGDPTRLAQMIGNLLHNAGKFTPAGGKIEVDTKLEAQRGEATVSVKDTGAGFEVNDISRLFEAFGQSRQTIDRAKGGLGLGLALTKGLVRLHQGDIEAISEGAGKGATFILRLPFVLGGEIAEQKNGGPHMNDNARSLNILLIEDNPDSAKSLQMLLALQGYTVRVALNGAEGLEAMRAEKPDVVISDLGLPGEIDGFKVAETVRAEPSLSNVHLIALSGYGQEGDRKRAQEAGFERHLVKPVELEELMSTMDSFSGSGASAG